MCLINKSGSGTKSKQLLYVIDRVMLMPPTTKTSDCCFREKNEYEMHLMIN